MSFPPRQPPGAGASSKVAIPRLDRRAEPPPRPTTSRQTRVSRACLSCRARKIKCNGATPTCSNCSENATECIYASSRKDRLKTATQQNQGMIALLKELRSHATVADRQKIEDMLLAVTEDVNDAAASIQQSLEKPQESQAGPVPERESEAGEANVTAEVGSNEDLDMLDEDLMRNEKSRATGFLGKPSEIQWLRKLHHAANAPASQDPSKTSGPYGPPGRSNKAAADRLEAMDRRRTGQPSMPSASHVTFFLDDEYVELDFMVDPFELPPFELAEKLMQSYMDSVQNTFPFLAKKSFLRQFYHYYAALRRGSPYKLPQKWQAMLNLVFAIGAVYCHLIEAHWRADEKDHLVYHSRAWALSLKDPWWFSHPDLPQMQVTGLLSFYYLSIGHINRSWVLIGMALRFGYSLGLHVRNEDRSATAARKEVLARIWWAHYSLEQIASAITGRPSVGAEKSISVPLPLPLPSEEIDEIIIQSRFGDRGKVQTLQDGLAIDIGSIPSTVCGTPDYAESASEPANSGSYLKHTVTVGAITQKTLNILYAFEAVNGSWASVQKSIVDLSEELDAWASSLPPALNFFHRDEIDHRYQREQNILELYHHSARILIMRPCLCRLDRRIENQSAGSNDFNKRAALACVGTAKAVSNLLPDDIERDKALVVLLLEISHEGTRFSEDRQHILPSLRKLMRWLMVIRENNRMAQRAYSIALEILQKLISDIDIDLSDILCDETTSTLQFDNQGQPQVFPEGYRLSGDQMTGQIHNEPMNAHNASMPDDSDVSQDQMPFHDLGAPPNPFFEFSGYPFASNSPLSNLFFTTFDEQNPLSFSSNDICMGSSERSVPRQAEIFN